MKTDFKAMSKLIKDAWKVAIVGHIRPDGDCVGSCVALRLALSKLKKSADIFIDDKIPETFSYMADYDKIRGAEYISAAQWKKYDLLILLDSSAEDRFGRCTELRANAKKVLVVDHHENTSTKGDVVVANPARGSVGEILYEFFTAEKIEITRDMATALYTSVATDTGCFAYATTSNTHLVAAALMEKGVDIEMINYNNFGHIKHETLAGLGYALQNLKFFLEGRVAVISIPYKIVKKYDLVGEMDYFKKYASDARGVKVGIIASEKQKGDFYISLRSHGEVNVAKIAGELGGGGHKNASGIVYHGKFKKILAELLARVEECLK